jgi:pyridoxamine 5'-phosphate oxidase
MTELKGLPAYYDDLKLSLDEAWGLLTSGVTDRHSPAHMPTVGTVDANGVPQLRIMVLRDVSRETRMLRFHTDLRSIKADQISRNSAAGVLVYDPTAKAQIRLSGHAKIIADGTIADTAWSASTPFARRCYMAESAPGTPLTQSSSGLPDWIEGKQPDEKQLADYRPNFAALMIEVDTIEWLYLANVGHRRARWVWNAAQTSWLGNWLVP